MNIVYDATVVREPLAGVQRSVRHQVAALLAQDQAQVTLYAQDEVLLRKAEAAGAAARRLPSIFESTAMRVLWQQTQLPKKLQDSAELLHAFAYTAPVKSPVPVLLNVHDLIALEHPEFCSRLNALHMRTLLARSIRKAAGVIVSAQAVADLVRQRFDVPFDRIFSIPLGVDFEFFAQPAGRGRNTDFLQERPFLLYVGNIEPKKGIPVLLDAYAAVAGEADCDLVLCGRAAWRSDDILQKISRYEGAGRVHWLKGVSDQAVRWLYQNAAAFVFPSFAEGFGMPVLEAMAAGCPVLHSDHPVLVETAGGAGIPFQRGSAEDLHRQVMRLLQSPALAEELVEKGRSRALSMPWSGWAERTLEARQMILNKG